MIWEFYFVEAHEFQKYGIDEYGYLMNMGVYKKRY